MRKIFFTIALCFSLAASAQYQEIKERKIGDNDQDWALMFWMMVE